MPITEVLRRVSAAYSAGERRPLRGYLATLCSYGALVVGATAVGRRAGVRLPDRVSVRDALLLSLATHKASRLLTKGAVTSVLRAPFARYDEPAGAAEVNESVRGDGARHAVGELVTCPFCSGVWIASAFTAGLVFAPRVTRLAATTLSAVAVSDWLHLLDSRLKHDVLDH
ncbi:hypothetical protein ALI22I_42025 [Saccharothrix sp. ALI-22-I]|uniref:DUF1360 domain-containing protein n=1 Tax=Saccharothrix sp. ALI-22-I TaxID=1933778 RepID=UPI00097C97A6|nr:DUF1360 domain-containing protein [Saccharothrix sp. ALI-22-I]ONI82620.1 hypothetical protein ALI22I_42025 [Saccharothrix sp. ALI-22-I]